MTIDIPAMTITWWQIALVLLYLATGVALGLALSLAGSVFGGRYGWGFTVMMAALWLPLAVFAATVWAGQRFGKALWEWSQR